VEGLFNRRLDLALFQECYFIFAQAAEAGRLHQAALKLCY
jgi:hypothetical protein